MERSRKKGRDTSDVIIMVVTFVLAYLFLLYGARLFDGQVDQNFGTWLIAGGLIGLGMIVPGLSPSNFWYIWDCTKRWLTDLKKFGLKSSCDRNWWGSLCPWLVKNHGLYFLKGIQ